MINQVEFEGYLTRAWEYHEQRYMRLANHRPAEDGRPVSSYVTVQVDPSLGFNPLRVQIGLILRVSGRIMGRDIVEPLRLVVSKSLAGIELPGELGRLIVRRPTVQILATQVRIQPRGGASRQRPSVDTIPAGQLNVIPSRSDGGHHAPAEVIPANQKEAVIIQPGQDLADVISTP